MLPMMPIVLPPTPIGDGAAIRRRLSALHSPRRASSPASGSPEGTGSPRSSRRGSLLRGKAGSPTGAGSPTPGARQRANTVQPTRSPPPLMELRAGSDPSGSWRRGAEPARATPPAHSTPPLAATAPARPTAPPDELASLPWLGPAQPRSASVAGTHTPQAASPLPTASPPPQDYFSLPTTDAHPPEPTSPDRGAPRFVPRPASSMADYGAAAVAGAHTDAARGSPTPLQRRQSSAGAGFGRFLRTREAGGQGMRRKPSIQSLTRRLSIPSRNASASRSTTSLVSGAPPTAPAGGSAGGGSAPASAPPTSAAPLAGGGAGMNGSGGASASPFPEPAVRPRAHRGMDGISLSVHPTTDHVHMFGSLQVTSNYSLSGSVHVHLPAAGDGLPAELEMTSLAAVLTGYALYADSSGRFACMKVRELRDEVLRAPLRLPLPAAAQSAQAAYEGVFDLFLPGWLPASFNARCSSTFYRLSTVATFANPKRGAPAVRVESPPRLVVLNRSRDMVPIPVAQVAVFSNAVQPAAVEEPGPRSTNPFVGRANTNPFRAAAPNPFRALSSAAHPGGTGHSPSPPPEAAEEDPARIASRIPLRHFAHNPQLRLPPDAHGPSDAGIPIKLTLSLPAHVHTHAQQRGEQTPLVFGLQVELDMDPTLARSLGGLRLRELEAMCVQMEKYCTVPSQSYCTAFGLSNTGPFEPASTVPVFSEEDCRRHPGFSTHHGVPLYPYNRVLVEGRLRLQRAGLEPDEQRNSVERFRSYTIGPVPQVEPPAASEPARGKMPERRPSVPTPRSGQDSALATSPSSRRKRVYSNALHRLSSFASSLRDGHEHHASEHDEALARSVASSLGSASTAGMRSPESRVPDVGGGGGGSSSSSRAQQHPKASYIFEGRDGYGIEVTQQKMRLSFSLPLVPSVDTEAKQLGVPQLLADYESPFVRVRHKLKVKLTFSYGTRRGLHSGVQSLLMCVPVRFTECPPREALAQSSPIVFPSAARQCVPQQGAPHVAVPAGYTLATQAPGARAQGPGAMPYLPAYTQLFREDGSRLADDAEDLPRYPDAAGMPARAEPAEDARFAAELQDSFVLAPDALRDQKSAAPISVMEPMNEDDFDRVDGEAHGEELRRPMMNEDEEMLMGDAQALPVETDTGDAEPLAANGATPAGDGLEYAQAFMQAVDEGDAGH